MSRLGAATVAVSDPPERADANFVVHATWALKYKSAEVAGAA